MSDLDLIRPQLYALKAQLDALIFLVEMHAGLTSQARPVDRATTCERCGSNGEQVADVTMLDGVPRRMCKSCRHEWTVL